MAEAPQPTLTAQDLAASILGGDVHVLPAPHARAFAARIALRAQPALGLDASLTWRRNPATVDDPRSLRNRLLAAHAAAHTALLAALGDPVPDPSVPSLLNLLEADLPSTGWPPPPLPDPVGAAVAAAATTLVGENGVANWLEVCLGSALGTGEDGQPAAIPREIAIAAAREDFQVLTTGNPGPVDGFLARPLWGPAQRSVLQVPLGRWSRRLQDVLLPELDDDYRMLLDGKPRTVEEVRRALDRSLGLAGIARTPAAPAPTPQQVSVPVDSKQDETVQVQGRSDIAAPQGATPPSPPELRVPLAMLSDEALGDDSADALDFRPYADALAGLITDPTTATPLTLAINAQWGAGKTTLARLVEKRLRGGAGDRSGLPHITCWFNAWAHDDAQDLSGAFVATVAQTVAAERPRWRRMLRPLPRALLAPEVRARRRAWLGIVLLIAVTALVSVAVARGWVANKLPDQIKPALPGVSLVVVLTTALLLLRELLAAAKTVGDFVVDPSSVAATGAVGAVRRQLERLIDQASRGDRRLVIFIDDLERCRPPRPVELLEVVNQLLGHKNVVTVILADMPALAACVEIKYKDLAERYRPSGTGLSAAGPGQDNPYLQAYGRLYLQKIVQLQFDIPPHTPQRIQALVQRLVATRSAPAAGPAAALTPAPAPPTAASPAADEARSTLTTLLDPGRRSRDARAYRAQAAATVLRSPTADVEEVLRAAPAPAGLQPETVRNIAREEVQRALVQPRSDIWNDAESEALKHLPLLPRNAKRLINRLRLLIFIAQERHLFTADRKGTAERIGKWGVLCERWPELANDAAQLEEYARGGATRRQDFNERVKRQSPYVGDEELWDFCRGDPELRPILSSLLHMDIEKTEEAKAKAAPAPSKESML